ncbi:hypothetical protein [Nocardiopsis rhodophaea]|uniref:hypothetical protein n=1 Tax=Nocardiopsis rhodophaea TaxID=280238 RepID=UPI0031E0C3B6
MSVPTMALTDVTTEPTHLTVTAEHFHQGSQIGHISQCLACAFSAVRPTPEEADTEGLIHQLNPSEWLGASHGGEA